MAVIDAFIHDNSTGMNKDKTLNVINSVIIDEDKEGIEYCVLFISDKNYSKMESIIIPRGNFTRLLDIYENQVDDTFQYKNNPDRVIEGYAFTTDLKSISEVLDVFI